MDSGLASSRRAAQPEPVTPELFKLAASHWPTGVAVITTIDGHGNPHGLTMSAVTSLSLSPMQFLICVDRRSATLPHIRESGLFCINLLSRGQEEIGMRFAGKAPDKFDHVGHRTLGSGLPAIEGALSWIGCKVASIQPGGDHEIIVGDVIEIVHPGGEALVHYRGRFHGLRAG